MNLEKRGALSRAFHEAPDRRLQCREIGALRPQKCGGHFDGEKPMPRVAAALGERSVFARGVGRDVRGRQFALGGAIVKMRGAGEVQADFQALRVKARRPGEVAIELKIVPLDADAALRETAEKRPPSAIDD